MTACRSLRKGTGCVPDETADELSARLIVGDVAALQRADVTALMARYRSVPIDRSDRTERDGEYRVSHWVASGQK
jgi:hypothetical protein